MQDRPPSAEAIFQEILDKVNNYIINNKKSLFDKKGNLTPAGKSIETIANIIKSYFKLPFETNDIFNQKNLSAPSPILFSLVGAQQPDPIVAADQFKKCFLKIQATLSQSKEKKLTSSLRPIVDNQVNHAITLIKELRSLEKEAFDKKQKQLSEAEKIREENFQHLFSKLPEEVWLHMLEFTDDKAKAALKKSATFFNQMMANDTFLDREIKKLSSDIHQGRKRYLLDQERIETSYEVYQRLVKSKKQAQIEEEWKQKIIKDFNITSLEEEKKLLRRQFFFSDTTRQETYKEVYERLKKEKPGETKRKLGL